MNDEADTVDGAKEFARELYESIKDITAAVSAKGTPSPQENQLLCIAGAVAALVLLAVIIMTVIRIIRHTNTQKNHRRLFEDARSHVKDMLHHPEHESAPQEQQSSDVSIIRRSELQELAVQCEALGSRIDAHTGRKSNSKIISSIVYRTALTMGIERNTAILYFCAAMVYDAGLLDIDAALLSNEITTSKERYLMMTHVQRNLSYFNFVPQKYYSEFIAASLYHHENPDGTGYPEGLTGDTIPLCARLIHVAEGYVSLITGRNSHSVLDRKGALSRLAAHPELYDRNTVHALSTLLTQKTV